MATMSSINEKPEELPYAGRNDLLRLFIFMAAPWLFEIWFGWARFAATPEP